jgi:hypothetical protein
VSASAAAPSSSIAAWPSWPLIWRCPASDAKASNNRSLAGGQPGIDPPRQHLADNAKFGGDEGGDWRQFAHRGARFDVHLE